MSPDSSPGSEPTPRVRRPPAVRAALFGCLVSALVVTPAALAVTAMVLFEPRATDVASTEPVSTLVASKVSLTSAQAAKITLSIGPGDALVAPAWAGMVTDVPVGQGDGLSPFVPVIEIEGIVRKAWRTERPFTRPLQGGDRGKDVQQLQEGLTALGLLGEHAAGRMDRATVSAVKAYSRSIGYASDVDIFDPGWVVFLPRESLAVATLVGVQVGAPAPPAGSRFVESPKPVAGATVALDSGHPIPPPASDWVVVLGEQALGVDEGGVVTGQDLTLIPVPDPAGGEAALVVTATLRVESPSRSHRYPAAHCQPRPTGASACGASRETAHHNKGNPSSSRSWTSDPSPAPRRFWICHPTWC